jgi:signal transduction histidine kinase
LSLADIGPVVLYRQRPDLSFEFVSPQISNLTGVPAAEWSRLPTRFWSVVHEADLEVVADALRTAGESSVPMRMTFRVRHRATGQFTCVRDHRRAVRGPDGALNAYEGMWLDVTREAQLLERLRRLTWNEAVSALTLGFAHDFNNLLAGMLALSEGRLAAAPGGAPAGEAPALLKKNLTAAGEMMSHITRLHRAVPGERNYAALNALVSELMDWLRRALSRRVTLRAELAPGQLPVFVDGVELRQAVLHLVRNATEAMPKGGTLTFRTAKPPPPLAGAPDQWRHTGTVCLTITDTGPGIPRTDLARVFDADYTTKPDRHGLGLGLPTALWLVEKNGGALTLDSTEGGGTCAHVWLPLADFSEAERERVPSAGKRRSLLWLGPTGDCFDRWAGPLWEQGYHVGVANSLNVARAWLLAPDHRYRALLVAGGEDAPAAPSTALVTEMSVTAAPPGGTEASKAASTEPPPPGGLANVWRELRRANSDLKLIRLTGASASDSAPTLPSGGADLMLAPDLSPSELLTRLDTLLKPKRP